MKISTNILEAAQKWLEKNWQPDQDYNISMNKVKDTKSPIWFVDFRDQQLIFNAKVDTFIEEQKTFNNKVSDFIEDQQKFNGQILDFVKKQLAFNELLLAIPTIKKELNDLKRQ